MLGVVETPLQVGLAPPADALPGIVDAGGGLGHGLVEVLGVALADREDQVVAVGEVQVDRGRRHPDGGGDGPDGERGLVVGLDEDALGRRQDLVAQLFALPPAGAGAAERARRQRIRVAVGEVTALS